MWLIIIAVIVVLARAIEFGFIAPPTASILVRIRNGSVRVERGSLNPSIVDHIASISREHGIRDGYVAISRDKRISFSRMIPEDVHQRMRNVLLNHMR
jgi:hypothetical protein